MEEVKAYIESGILEQYVLGELSASENASVLDMANKHPEIANEIAAIEEALTQYALANAIAPSANKIDTILAAIGAEEQTGPKEVPVVKLEPQPAKGNVKILRFALVACVGLLVICFSMLISVMGELKNAKSQIASLALNRQQLAQNVSKLEFDNQGMENQLAMLESPEWRTVKLAGVNDAPTSKMLVYWNKNDKSVLINYSAMSLPTTDESHQFQLWALVDGKPVSLGVFGGKIKEAVVKMQTVTTAQAFAVTIEPMGGSVNPTMDKMVVMGAI